MVTRFDVQSDLDIAADGYTVAAAGAAEFLAAALGQQMTLAAGLVDPATGTPYTVRHVVGRIDEYTLTVGPSSITASLRGRDQMALVLEGTFRKVYFRSQPDQKTQDALARKTRRGPWAPTRRARSPSKSSSPSASPSPGSAATTSSGRLSRRSGTPPRSCGASWSPGRRCPCSAWTCSPTGGRWSCASG